MCDDWGTYLGDCYGCGTPLYNLSQMDETILDDELDEYFCGADCRVEYRADRPTPVPAEVAA